jgi:dephospho-CoA kinase
VAALFAELGAKVIDADAICSELQQTPAIREAIRRRWGRAVFTDDGELDRARLADRVFSDPAELDALNRIMHPAVIEQVKAEVAACRAEHRPPWCVIDAPLLLETGLIELCDMTLFIECDRTTRLQRLADARGWRPDEIQRREARQAPLERKRDRADHILVNGGDRAATRRQIERFAAAARCIGDQRHG